MKYRIQDMSWVEFDQRRKETKLVIVPTGAVEVYGPHLPMGADGIVADEMAIRVAERTGAVVAPLLGLGDSSMLMDFPGTLTIRKSTYEALMDDLCLCLINYGFKNFLFINGHAGNVEIINGLARQYQKSYGVRCGQIDWWRFAAANSGDIFDQKGYMAQGHAGECGTSVLLYLRPDLVDMTKALRVEPTSDVYEIFTDVIRYIPFHEKTSQGMIGDATKATSEKGRLLIEKCLDRIVNYVAHEFDTGPKA